MKTHKTWVRPGEEDSGTARNIARRAAKNNLKESSTYMTPKRYTPLDPYEDDVFLSVHPVHIAAICAQKGLSHTEARNYVDVWRSLDAVDGPFDPINGYSVSHTPSEHQELRAKAAQDLVNIGHITEAERENWQNRGNAGFLEGAKVFNALIEKPDAPPHQTFPFSLSDDVWAQFDANDIAYYAANHGRDHTKALIAWAAIQKHKGIEGLDYTPERHEIHRQSVIAFKQAFPELPMAVAYPEAKFLMLCLLQRIRLIVL